MLKNIASKSDNDEKKIYDATMRNNRDVETH